MTICFLEGLLEKAYISTVALLFIALIITYLLPKYYNRCLFVIFFMVVAVTAIEFGMVAVSLVQGKSDHSFIIVPLIMLLIVIPALVLKMLHRKK